MGKLFFAGLFGLVMLCGCAKPPTPRVFWPPPPAQPRVEFIGAYRGEADLEKNDLKMMVLGAGGRRLNQPAYVCSDGEGLVYISETVVGRITLVDLNTGKLTSFAEGSVGQPRGLALDARGRLFVADQRSRQILVFTKEGQPLFHIGGPEDFVRPYDIAINEGLQRLYVTDDEGHKVVIFDLEGNLVGSFGERGYEEGKFNRPTGVAVDGDNRVFVADHRNARIEVFDAEGTFLYAFGTRGAQYTNFEAPKGLAFDSEGNLWITDFRKGLLFTYSPEGRMLLFTGTKGEAKGSPFGFNSPQGLFIDAHDRIYVVDYLYQRLSIWQYLSADYLEKHPIPSPKSDK